MKNFEIKDNDGDELFVRDGDHADGGIYILTSRIGVELGAGQVEALRDHLNERLEEAKRVKPMTGDLFVSRDGSFAFLVTDEGYVRLTDHVNPELIGSRQKIKRESLALLTDNYTLASRQGKVVI